MNTTLLYHKVTKYISYYEGDSDDDDYLDDDNDNNDEKNINDNDKT